MDHTPMTTIGDIPTMNNDPNTYTEKDKKLFDRENKALCALILCLSTEINYQFGGHHNAKSIYDALCEFNDRNEDLMKDKSMEAQ